MPGNLGKVVIQIAADVAKLQTDMQRADRTVANSLNKISKRASVATKAIIGIGGALAVGGLSSKIIDATVKQEAAVRQLEQGLASTGGVVGQSLEQLTQKAAELQKATTFGDEEIIKAQSALVTFTNITRGEFDRTIESALNLSARLGTDLQSSVLQLGKALNDPVKNLSALSRAGIQFSESQIETVKALVETGRLADAQRIILSELETQFGGSARAARDTLGGALDSLGNAFGDLLESEGGLNSAKQGIEELTAILQDPQTIQAAQALAKAVIDSIGAITKLASTSLNTIRFLAEELAAFINGPAIGDIVRIEDELIKKRERLADLESQRGGRSKEARNNRIQDLRSEIEQLERLLELSKPKEFKTPTLEPVDVGANTDSGVTTSIVDPKVIDQGNNVISILERRIALSGELTEREKALYEIQKGQYADFTKAQQTQILDLSGRIDQKNAEAVALAEQESRKASFDKLVEDLRSQEQVIADSYLKRAQIIRDNTEAGSDKQISLLSNLDAGLQDDVLGNLAQPDTFKEQLQQIEDFYASRSELLKQLGKEDTDLAVKLEEEKNERIKALQNEQLRFTAAALSDGFGALADLTKQFAGEQSDIYKGMFAASKAFAIAESTVKIIQGIANAASLTFPANIAAMGTVAANTANLVSQIQGVNYSGAYDNGGYIPPGSFGIVGEYGPEFVSGPANVTSRKKTREMIERAENNSGGTVVNITQNIVNRSSKEVSITSNYDETTRTINTFVDDVVNNGRASQALSQHFGIKRVGSF